MRVVIVDDEPFARAHVARLCRTQRDLELVAEADSGAAAIDVIKRYSPDVVLLDVDLRDMTGFDVLHRLEGEPDPLAIMITAHPEHALTAFDTGALDYLTKPINDDRFLAAIERARRRTQRLDTSALQDLTNTLRAALAASSPGRSRGLQIIGEKVHRLYFIVVDNVDYIESDGNYVTINVGDQRYISRATLKHLVQLLGPAGFVRIERDLLLNLRRVAFAERRGRGEFSFTLRTGQELVSGRAYRRTILDAVQRLRTEGAH